jgi:hypothetical protein
MTVLSGLEAAGRRRSPATLPRYHAGRPPRNKGMRYPRVKVRRLRLRGGTYLWQECVRATTGRFYEHSSGLWRGSGYASLESVQAPGYGDGQHHWGSTLRRIGP